MFFRPKKIEKSSWKKKFAKRSGKCGALPVVAKRPLQSAQRDLMQILLSIGAAWVGPITYISCPNAKKWSLHEVIVDNLRPFSRPAGLDLVKAVGRLTKRKNI